MREKLNSQRGASLLIALLYFLVCGLVAAVIIGAAMTNVQQRKMRPLFAYAARCELDGQGRILLPQHLREFAGLTKSVTVVGSNNHAEFWDSARWDEICPLEALPENIAAVMEELDF